MGCAAASADGKAAATGDESLVRLWDLASGREVGPPLRKAGRVLALAYSPDGSLLLVGDESGEARLHDARDGTPVGGRIALRSDDSIELPVGVDFAAFEPDGRSFQAAGLRSQRRRRRTPTPTEGDPAALARRVSALTGLELDAADRAVPLDPGRWRELRQSFEPREADAAQP